MKFSTREDVAAPIGIVFRAVSDFDGFERSALRRGADVVRTDALAQPGQGMTWQAQFPLRNRTRKAMLELVSYDPDNGLQLFTISAGIEATLVVDLVALSRNRTRMNMSIDLRPKTISARLMIQSMKLAKANLTKRFRQRVAEFSTGIEERYSPQTA